MNDDELREHLHATLAPVAPPSPELTRLRRLARRRRRRLQVTSATLGLLLLAGAGIGIAEATNTGSGRSELTVASPPPASTVSVSCAIATHATKSLEVEQGQSLVLTDCPDGATATASGNGVLSPTGPLAFRADKAGSDGLDLRYSSCAFAPATVRPNCVGGGLVFSLDVTVTGTRAGPSFVKGPPSEVVPCRGGRVAVLVGQRLDLMDCPVGMNSHIDDPSVLAAGSGQSSFTGAKTGTMNVELFVKAECSPGLQCARNVRDLGTLVVTVTGP